jgi:hypothetical protein
MPPHPSPTDERLRETIAKRMGKRPIEQRLVSSRCECGGAGELQLILWENR